MTAAVSFSSLSIGIRPVAATGQLAELSKREQALNQKLAEASKATPPPPSSVSADSIAREISGVQAQIEQVILEAQLSKLNTSANTNTSGNADGSSSTADTSGGSPAGASASASPGSTGAGTDSPAALKGTPNGTVAKDGKADHDPRTGTSVPGTGNPDSASATGHGPGASRLSAAAAAQYGQGLGTPSANHLDLRV